MARRHDVLDLLVFGPGAAAVYLVAFKPPARVGAVLAGHDALAVGSLVLVAAAAAFCCRRVVQSLLRLSGFR